MSITEDGDSRRRGDFKYAGDCDWGDCAGDSVGVRNDKPGHGWLPVCQHHYDEAPEDERALHGTYETYVP